jgi:hypothetical protein
LIQSWSTDLASGYHLADWPGIRQYLEHETNIKRISLANSAGNYKDIYSLRVWVQFFLSMPKLQSLVFLSSEYYADVAFQEHLVSLVKPHMVRAWREQRREDFWDSGLEVVKVE